MRWRRLDVPGTDECALTASGSGWQLDGIARYGAGDAAELRYHVTCDAEWRTVTGRVDGRVGPRRIRLAIERDAAGTWTVDGVAAPELHGLIDLDLGFTPATNLFPLRRLALQVGTSADAEAAWLDDEAWRLSRLPQRYQRRDQHTWWYESPSAGYAGLLAVNTDGFVTEYPGLWTATD
jgi:hypothetical protein